MDQVVVVGQDERTALLDLQAVLVARYLPLTRLQDGGEILSAQPGLVGHLRRRNRRENDINRCRSMILCRTGGRSLALLGLRPLCVNTDIFTYLNKNQMQMF